MEEWSSGRQEIGEKAHGAKTSMTGQSDPNMACPRVLGQSQTRGIFSAPPHAASNFSHKPWTVFSKPRSVQVSSLYSPLPFNQGMPCTTRDALRQCPLIWWVDLTTRNDVPNNAFGLANGASCRYYQHPTSTEIVLFISESHSPSPKCYRPSYHSTLWIIKQNCPRTQYSRSHTHSKVVFQPRAAPDLAVATRFLDKFMHIRNLSGL